MKQHLLLSEMRQQQMCIHNLNKKAKQLENSLYSIVGYVTRVYIMRFLDKQIEASKSSFQSTHAKKLESLGLNLNSIDNKLPVVINQSNYKLSETETNLLNKGLKFGTFPDKLDKINIETEFEDFYQQVRPSLIQNNDRLEFKAKLMHLYSKYKSTFYHNRKQQQNTFGLLKEEQAALHNLSHNNSIIICKPDKGNGVVILNRQDYIQKMEQILCNKNPFQSVDSDDNISNLAKFQQFLYRLKKSGAIQTEIYNRIRPAAAATPTLYGLPKIHKEGTPCRPILASYDSFAYECAVWLSEILTPLREQPSNIKDTFDFVSRILSSKPGPNHMVSFDVKSLSTNIPIDFVIDQILEKSFPDKKALFHGLTHSQFKKLLIWTTKKTTLQFNNRYFKQINGAAMGSPFAPLLSDVCMNWLIDQSQKIETQPMQLYRYVDDCFATFEKRAHITEFYKHLNSIHPNIQFTYELAQNNQLAFLDVWISNQDGKPAIKTYRKPTHTGLYIKWQSFVPLKYKINLVRNLLHRAYKICNSYSLIHEISKLFPPCWRKTAIRLDFLVSKFEFFSTKCMKK